MNVDAVAKRGFPLIVGATLMAIAFFQGAGIASLIAEQLPTPGTKPTAVRAQGPVNLGAKGAQPILARNAFDSETGPISTNKPPPRPPPIAQVESTTGEMPSCSGGEVVLIAGSEDPAFSFALIKSSGPSKMHRVGDDVSGQKIRSIEWDHLVLEGGGSPCAMRIHKDIPGGAADAASGAARTGARPERSSVMPPVAGTGEIVKVADNEYVVEKDGAEKIKLLKQSFMKSARVVEGQGLRLQRSAQTTILGQLGLEKGDLVKTINGHDMTNPDKAMEAYGAMNSAKRVQIVVERAGKSMTVDLTIK